MTPEQEANAKFIAHAREDIPALLAHIDTLTRERDEAIAVHESVARSLDDRLDDVEALTAEVAALRAERDAESSALSRTIDERDRHEDLLDKFVDAFGGVPVFGEHSNVNSPWHRALEHAEELQYQYNTALAANKQLAEELALLKRDLDPNEPSLSEELTKAREENAALRAERLQSPLMQVLLGFAEEELQDVLMEKLQSERSAALAQLAAAKTAIADLRAREAAVPGLVQGAFYEGWRLCAEKCKRPDYPEISVEYDWGISNSLIAALALAQPQEGASE